MNALTRVLALSLGALSFGLPAAAQTADAGAAPAPTAASATVVDSKTAESCVERVPSGKDRPHFTEKIAQRALSGHALTLEVVV